MRIVTIEKIAEAIGMKESWIYARTGDGALKGTGRGRKRRRTAPADTPAHPPGPQERIPHFKAGRLLRFDLDEVLTWWAEFHRNGVKPSVCQTEGASQPTANTPVN